MAFAAWLRLSPLLGRKSVLIDDLLQYYAVTRPSLRECWAAVSGIGPLQAPLDYLLDFAAARVLPGLGTLSLLPAAWGIAAVAVLYVCGRRVRGPFLGAAWALLLAVSIPHISYSQTLRPYALAVLLSALSLHFYLQALEGRRLKAYAAAMTLFQLAFVHAAFIGAAHLAYAALRRKGWRALAAALLPSWACLLAWFAVTGRPLAEGPVFRYHVGLFNAFEHFAQMSRPLGVLLLASAAAAAAWGWRERDKGGEAAPAAAFSLIATAAMMYAAHTALRVVFLPRHTLVLLPYYFGLAAAGFTLASEAAGRVAGKAARVSALALLCFAALAGSLPALEGHLRFEESVVSYFRDAALLLRRSARPGDELVMPNPNTGAALLYYLDEEAFHKLEAPRMRKGFVLFGFPKDLTARVDAGELPAHSLCVKFPEEASLDAPGLAEARRRAKKAGGRVWLAHLGSLSYFREPVTALSSVGVSTASLSEAFPGVYLLGDDPVSRAPARPRR